MLPNEYNALPPQVRAFIYAAYMKRQQDYKKLEKDLKQK